MTASTDNEARSPSMRAVAFSLTIASAACGGTPALSSAACRSWSEMNGTPPASSTCGWEARSLGTAGLFWTPLRNDAVKAEMSTAPASAVPMEAPRWVTVFWIPPTSPLCSSGTEETVTAPSWEASAPTPRPASSISQVTMSGPAPASSAATMITMPANSATNPIWTTRRGEAFGKTLGTPAAASSSVRDSGSSRTPVAIADRPSATDKNNGTAKNRPACRKYWKKNDVSPPRRVRVPQHRRIQQHGAAARQAVILPPQEEPQHHPAGQDQPDHRREPEPRGSTGLGLDQTPRPGAQDAVDDQPDGEGALAAEDLAELAAGDHERGHHQRVEGNRGLDPRHRRADVLGDRCDRHVHDRTVQRHEELRRGQRQQHDPGRRSRALTGAAGCGLSA